MMNYRCLVSIVIAVQLGAPLTVSAQSTVGGESELNSAPLNGAAFAEANYALSKGNCRAAEQALAEIPVNQRESRDWLLSSFKAATCLGTAEEALGLADRLGRLGPLPDEVASQIGKLRYDARQTQTHQNELSSATSKFSEAVRWLKFSITDFQGLDVTFVGEQCDNSLVKLDGEIHVENAKHGRVYSTEFSCKAYFNWASVSARVDASGESVSVTGFGSPFCDVTYHKLGGGTETLSLSWFLFSVKAPAGNEKTVADYINQAGTACRVLTRR
jgi:hypothetical protein